MNSKSSNSGQVRGDASLLEITPDTLIDADQVAAALHISVRTLRTLRHLREVPLPITIGRRVLWRRLDVAQFLIDKAS